MMNTKTVAQQRINKRKKGFTLTEIAIVLGIIGLILGAIWVAAAGVYNNQRINQGQTAILQTVQAVRTLYAQQATITAGDNSAALINAGVVPTNLINGAKMISPWGGDMYVGGTADGLGITVEMDKMSSALCVGLVSAIYGASHDRTLTNSGVVGNANLANYVAVATIGTEVTGSAPPLTGGSPVANPATGTGCTAGSNTNSQIFVFGLQG